MLASLKAAFGEPASYQPAIAGIPNGEPIPLTVVRRARVRDEAGPAASFEEVSVDPADLPAPPAKGDQVTVWGLQYTVTLVRQPDPYGWAVLVLQQRASQVLLNA